ncbi:hypothetical protein [Nocardioides stalactiti]|uniref:hypothetical protein n=1 Tax=Nocardioides stalactiti TaxID=2755356 RepID=UPI0015FF9EDF|nr:hypothetical protein [Nocardioides stalactiti]
MSAPVTGLVVTDRDGSRLLTLTLPGLVTRLCVVLPVFLALVVVDRLAPEAPWWPPLVLVVLAAAAAELPDTSVGLVTLGGLVAWWLHAVTGPSEWWALLVAGCGLAFHTALAHAAAGPPGCTPTWAVVRRLAARCTGVLLVTGALALVVEIAEEGGEPPLLVVGLALALVAALPWAVRRG